MPEAAAGINMNLSDLKRLPEIVKKIERAGSNTSKPIKRFNAYHVAQTIRTFNKGGRGHIKWPRLRPATKKIKKRRGQSMKPLIATGTGRNSVQGMIVKASRNERYSVTFTRLKYMKDHQEGRPKRKPPLPARPQFFYTTRDIAKMVELVKDHAARL